jgi:hypothetical protein
MDIKGEWFLGIQQVEGQNLEKRLLKAPKRGVNRGK